MDEKLDAVKGGLAYSVDVGCYFALSLIATVIFAAFKLSGTQAALYINYLVSPVAIFLTAVFFFKAAKVPVARMFPVKTKPKYYLIGVLLIFGLLFSLSRLNGYFIELLKLMGLQPKTNAGSLPDLSGGKIVPALLVVAVLPAVMEECLFRGIILGGAEEETGTVRAIFIVGFLFSLYHGSPEQTLYQFICGCLFALLAVRSRSVLPGVVIHFLNNALIIIFSACNLIDASGNLALSFGWDIALTVLSSVSLIAAVVLLIFDKTPLKQKQEGGVKKFFIWASVGIGAMALVWILGLFGL